MSDKRLRSSRDSNSPSLHETQGDSSVARESPFESEARLHEAVTSHPEALPSEDLNLGPLVSVATELDFGAGPMDLLAADAQGRLIIIEFKRGTENPDVRQVIAQMLDYGSSLWRTSYSDLEQEVARRQPGGLGSLVEVARERFLKLETAFEDEAFIKGITTCLERGNFVFMYVARDLDQRTRRVMTYLADGAQMTFFAVEVDYFTQEAAGGNAVLVPRTAFIPSWIASGEPADARRSSGPRYDIAKATAEVRSFVEHMDGLAQDLGLIVRRAPGGPHYHPAAREPGVSFSMGVGVNVARQSADINVLAFRERGEDGVADDMLARIRRITGITKIPPSWPSVPCAALIKDWTLTRNDLMEPYFRARAANHPEASSV